MPIQASVNVPFTCKAPMRRLYSYCYDEHGYCEGDKLVNMERFIDNSALSQYKSGIRFTKRYRDLLYAGADAELQANKELHARLEALYGEAMDFARKEEFTKRLLMKIFELKRGSIRRWSFSEKLPFFICGMAISSSDAKQPGKNANI